MSYPSWLSTQILTWFVFFSGSSVPLSTSTLPWFSSQPIFLPVCSLKSVHLSLHFSTLFVRYTCPNTVHFFLLSSTAFHSPLLHSSELYGVVPSLLSPVNPLSYLISVISQPNNAKYSLLQPESQCPALLNWSICGFPYQKSWGLLLDTVTEPVYLAANYLEGKKPI